MRPCNLSKEYGKSTIKEDNQKDYRESDKPIVLKILGIINLEEKRGLHNIALDRETLTIHRDRGDKTKE